MPNKLNPAALLAHKIHNFTFTSLDKNDNTLCVI